MRVFLMGQFKLLRNRAASFGKENEMRIFLNSVQSFWGEYLKAQGGNAPYAESRTADPVVGAFLRSPLGSFDFYKNLFVIAREAGFTFEDRPAMEDYFKGVDTMNRRKDEENVSLDEHLKNADFAMKVIFPAFGRQVPRGETPSETS